MKIALCTTTVHIPHALALMKKFATLVDVRFFVAGDRNTPKEAYEFVLRLGANFSVCLPESGHAWKCSEAIGWNTIARRNIAFLEAIKWGADVIVSYDDDNIPVTPDYFNRFAWAIQHPFNGIKVTGTDGWFDPGTLLIPATRHRGFPHGKRPSLHASPVIDAKIGVAAGLVIGDPDIDAVTRMEKHPDIGGVHILGSTGVVVDLNTWTVFNSQNTAVIRELMPAWFMMPGVGRHDDIYAGLILQRVARERGYHVRFGQPFTYQQRNDHDLIKDLRAEIDGMEQMQEMAELLDSIVLPDKSVIEDTRIIYDVLNLKAVIPHNAYLAATAWLEDCEGVL